MSPKPRASGSRKNRRSKEVSVHEAELSPRQCTRDAGGGWTCKLLAVPGHRLCTKHMEERKERSRKHRERLRAMREAAGGTLGKEFLKARPPRRKKNDSDPPHTRRTLQQVQAVPPLGERQQDVATKQHDESPSDLQQRMSVEHFNISRQQLNVFSNDMHDWAAHQPSEVVEPVMQYVSTLFAQFKPSLERCTQRLYGAQHVGSRCAVYRKGDKTSYPGQLVDYNPLSGHHKIRHDDGSMFWELLGSSDVVSTIECCTSNDRQEAIARDNPPAMVVCAGDGLCSASPEPESGRKSGPDADQHGQAEEAPMQEIGLNKSPSLPRKDRSLPVGASGVVPSFSLQSWLRSYQHRATAGA